MPNTIKQLTVIVKVIFILLFSLNVHAQEQAAVPHHQLKVSPDVKNGTLGVVDIISLPEAMKRTPFTFVLNNVFEVKADGKRLQPARTFNDVNEYRIHLPPESNEIRLEYEGRLVSTPQCAWLKQACLLLNEQGVFVDGSSYWYPRTHANRQTFDLEVSLPSGWSSLSQGAQLTSNHWRETHPQDNIYLIGGNFKVYREKGEHADAMVYLLKDDPELARRYLEATRRYLGEYSRLIGDYPYAKFATVESFWETGWGMPSFTLLGSRVIRLPFILHTSFPHEILHNWWGNGVYVDYASGNWSEGLTAYLADHRLKEQAGEGTNYRRSALQKFANFVAEGNDFPLKKFTSRHNNATQAIGYSKSLMFFHMLRKKLGDDAFYAGLRQFYRDNLFKKVSFADLRQAFEKAGKQPLAGFFVQWLERTGAPQIRPAGLKMQRGGNGRRITFTLEQQSKPPYKLDVPLKISHRDSAKVTEHIVTLQNRQQPFTLELADDAEFMGIDPEFDLFRLPLPEEIPAALNALSGNAGKTVVISRDTAPGMELAWDDLAREPAGDGQDVKVIYDDEALADTPVVILLGADNAHFTRLAERTGQQVKLTETAYELNSQSYTCGLHSLALALKVGEQTIVLLDAPTPKALATLMRKVPHYGKYSYVLFDVTTGKNVAKGEWEVTRSPMLIDLGKL